METQVTENIEVTIQERIYATRKTLSSQFLGTLKNLGLHIAENAMVIIHETKVEIGIRKDEYNFEFNSEFTIYSRDSSFKEERKNSISISSASSFTPENTSKF